MPTEQKPLTAEQRRRLPHWFLDSDLQIPGCGNPALHDPCCHTELSYTGFQSLDVGYDGHALTPLEVAHQRGWIPCYACILGPSLTHDSEQYSEPDPLCECCHGTGVTVWAQCASEEVGPDDHPNVACLSESCVSCGAFDRHHCAECLGTGWNFRPAPDAYAEYTQAPEPTPPGSARTHFEPQQRPPLRYGEYAPLEEPVDDVLRKVWPEPENKPPFVLEVRTLESKQRVPCNACDQGVESVSKDGGRTWDLKECSRCHGKGDRPAVRGKWLCNVDTDTGEYWPKHLPVQHDAKYGLVRARHYSRNWRESDGKVHPVRTSKRTTPTATQMHQQA